MLNLYRILIAVHGYYSLETRERLEARSSGRLRCRTFEPKTTTQFVFLLKWLCNRCATALQWGGVRWGGRFVVDSTERVVAAL